jgi:hypothetical protein
MTAEEPIENNDLECVILKKNGEIERVSNGKLEQNAALPRPGDGYLIGTAGYRVVGHAYTPELPVTWHLFLQEA